MIMTRRNVIRDVERVGGEVFRVWVSVYRYVSVSSLPSSTRGIRDLVLERVDHFFVRGPTDKRTNYGGKLVGGHRGMS